MQTATKTMNALQQLQVMIEDSASFTDLWAKVNEATFENLSAADPFGHVLIIKNRDALVNEKSLGLQLELSIQPNTTSAIRNTVKFSVNTRQNLVSAKIRQNNGEGDLWKLDVYTSRTPQFDPRYEWQEEPINSGRAWDMFQERFAHITQNFTVSTQ